MNSATTTAECSPLLGSQNSAAVHYGIDSSEEVSNAWYAANQGGGAFTVQSAASGLAALVAAAEVSSDQWTFCVVWFAKIRAAWSLLKFKYGFSGAWGDFRSTHRARDVSIYCTLPTVGSRGAMRDGMNLPNPT